MNKTQPGTQLRIAAHNLAAAVDELYKAVTHGQATEGGIATVELTSKIALIDRQLSHVRNAFANSVQT